MAAHHEHPHKPPLGSSRVLLIAVGLTGGFALVEAVGGWLSGSLALLADAGHMVSDALALGFAAAAAVIAQRPATARHTFGLGRVEVVAATVNAVFLLGVVAAVVWAAIGRLQQPVPVAGGTVLLIATAGLAVNLLVAWMLLRGPQSLNVRAAFLHVLGDILGSIAALTSGAVILLTGWMPIDPLLSLFISVLIVISCIRLLREALHVVMEAVPRGIDQARVGVDMAAVAGVREVHDLHIWQVASGNVMLTAHVVIESMDDWEDVHRDMLRMLSGDYGIGHVTLQPEIMRTG